MELKVIAAIAESVFKAKPFIKQGRPDDLMQGVHQGSMGRTTNKFRVWAWSPDIGFKEMPDCVGEFRTSNYGHDGGYSHAPKCKLPAGLPILVHRSGASFWEGMEEANRWDVWELYPPIPAV